MSAATQTVDTRRPTLGRTGIEKILWAGFFTPGGFKGRWGLPYVLVGKPGTAKTSTLHWLAEKMGVHFEGVIASLRDPTDFLGLGVPYRMPLTPASQHLSPDGDPDVMIMKYTPPSFAVNCAVAKRALLNLDEVNTAPPRVQAALLRVLFEGVCGDLELPPGVRMFLAMNATEDAAGGWNIAPPLANRVGWLNWAPPESKNFVNYLMGAAGGDVTPIDPAAEERAVMAVWPHAWAQAAGQVAGFLSATGDQLFAMPKSGSKQASQAWPSPRTWELAARAKAAGYVYQLADREISESVAAFVGDGAAGTFHTWIRNNDLPDPLDVLDGKVPFVHDPRRLDRSAAILTAATSLVTAQSRNVRAGTPEHQLNAQRAETLWGVHFDLSDKAPDLSLGSVVSMVHSKLMIGSSTAYRVLAKMEPVMSAAGVTPDQTGRP